MLRHRASENGQDTLDTDYHPDHPDDSKLHGLVAGRGYGNMFMTATSVLHKVAAHVAGGPDGLPSSSSGAAASDPKVKAQLEVLKDQVMTTARENELLQGQLVQLERQLELKQEEADLLAASTSNVTLFKQEIMQEQLAHTETRSQLQRALKQLQQVRANGG